MAEVIGHFSLKTAGEQGVFYTDALMSRGTVEESNNVFDDNTFTASLGFEEKGTCFGLKTVDVDVSCITQLQGTFEDVFKKANNYDGTYEVTVIMQVEVEED